MQDSQKLIEACQRLLVNPDFKLYTEHITNLRQLAVNQFTNASPAELQVMQGRVQTFNHVLGVPNVAVKN